jgi:hypothetical protein
MAARRVWFALVLAALLPAGRPAAARPPAPPPLPDATPARPLDAAFARAVVAERPTRHILRSIAVDVDHDGDLDVVAATVEEPVVIWIRDGSGRFTRQRPVDGRKMGADSGLASASGGSGVFGEAPASRWQSPAETADHRLAADRPARHARARGASALPTRAIVADRTRGPPPSVVA